MSAAVIVAIAISVPVILFPVAFIWFINISGLWTVWKESRARERKRAKARKEALVRATK